MGTHIVDECVEQHCLWEGQIKQIIDKAIPQFETYLLGAQRFIYKHIHCRLVHNSGKGKKLTYLSTAKWLSKLWCIYSIDYNVTVKKNNEYELKGKLHIN